MPTPFLLDTNSYFLIFQPPPKPSSYFRLIPKIQDGSKISFYIFEISSMELHSVLGEYRRGKPRQRQQCNREIIAGDQTVKCSNTWVFPGIKKMPRKVFRDIQKMIADVEAGRGDIQATILKLDSDSIEKARKLLIKYADRYNFGSHDALIAGSFIAAREIKGMNLTLVTSDRGLQAVLRDESIPFYAPAREP